MSKVLFVRSTPYEEDFNGYNVQGVGIAKAFCSLGYDCDYLSYTKGNEYSINLCNNGDHNARVIIFKRTRFFRSGICFKALSKDFLSNYDIVILREYNQIMTHLIAKRHCNASMYSGPYWNMFMLPVMSKVYDLLYTKKLNKELKCKFVKSQMAKEFLENKGYTDLIDIGVGIDTTRFNDVTISESTSNLVELMQQNKCILYVGTLDENKNIKFILDVFVKLINTEHDLKLILIGKSHQNIKNKLKGKKEESYYEELINQYSSEIRKAVLHLERVENPQLQFVYPLAKVFILPSIHEIFGMVMLEAMYFGAPVITSKNGGSSTLIKSDQYGQRMDDYDIDKWVSGILRYLHDDNYTSSVIENGKRLIRNQYTWEVIVEKMINNINKCS